MSVLTTKYNEKVICLYCNKEVTLKNLKSHNETKHNGDKLHYKSAISRNISSMFKSPSTQSSEVSLQSSSSSVLQSEDNVLEDCADQPPSKIRCVRDNINDDGVGVPEDRNTSIKGLSYEVSRLSSIVNTLINSGSRPKSKEAVGSLPSKVLEDEDKHSLIKHARGLSYMLKWLDADDWLLVEGGLRCVACSRVISYDYDTEGREFEEDEKLPVSFNNFKKSVLRHIKSDSHLQNYSQLKQMRKEDRGHGYS